ncbi:Cmx/CmrA family chloramphenicol efflux MFS transporter [Streptomyces natalensis]|uniref:Chemotaxis protein n=1 Tax=Streptomyces natalensis ATCC 27448 TaxID=1240678 RepID=A0A0D7CF08_9ACTN|nr:Cmx/CmrA family chloramphenicol efflux MFS transporter [Streptomyces natalensis]KIZ13992.1 chemotaxis protein [Streptomyces natalensis ATCC 27448]
MPFTVHVLALAVFAQGTSEFMLSGLVWDIAHDLHVSIPTAGALTSAFAIGMVIGAPLMAVLSLRWPRRRALLTFLAAFLIVHVVGAVTTSFALLLVTRVGAALANAGFLAVAVATAAGMATPDTKGRATSVLLGGVTLACIVGVPAGAWLGQLWGWRSAFWAVALVSLPPLIALLRSLPSPRTATPTASSVPSLSSPSSSPCASSLAAGARAELRSLRNPRLLVTLALGALVNGATFCAYTYLAPLVTTVTGLAPAWVPAVLALFGLGSFLGVTLGGRFADARPLALLVTGGPALLVGWAVFALTATVPAATAALTLVQGTLSFAVGSTLISQVLYTAADAPTLAGGFATAAFNVGGALGPWLGGLPLTVGLDYRAPLGVSALLVTTALAVAGAAQGLRRGADRGVADESCG